MHCVQILRELAAGGRSIITTIHQPSSRLYQSLDKLLLLSQVKRVCVHPVIALVLIGQSPEGPCHFVRILANELAHARAHLHSTSVMCWTGVRLRIGSLQLSHQLQAIRAPVLTVLHGAGARTVLWACTAGR